MAVAAPLAAGFYDPALSPLYGLFEQSPLYAAYDAALFLAVAAAIPRRYIRELALNAYEVLGAPSLVVPTIARPVAVKGAGLPKSFWGAIWATSARIYVARRANTPQGRTLYAQRTSIFKLFLPVSVAGVAVYSAAASLLKEAAYPIAGIVFYILILFFFTLSAIAVSGERLWLSLSSDPAKYFKYRMSTRTLVAAVLLSPWAAAYALQSAFFPPALYLAASLCAAVLILPTLGWIVGAYVGIPQTRELNLPLTTQRLTLRATLGGLILLATLGLFFLPYVLALVAIFFPTISGPLPAAANAYTAAMLAFSAAFFYLVVISQRGYGVWRRVVERLIESGYV